MWDIVCMRAFVRGVHPCALTGACAGPSSTWYIAEAMHQGHGQSHASVRVMGGTRMLVGA